MQQEEEIWKPCPGYEKWYDISNFGNVRSYHVKGSHKRVIVPKLMKPYIETYIRVTLSKGFGKPKYNSIHTLVAKAFVANPHKRKYVHHKDNDKLNPAASNLEWVTMGQNQKYAYDDGLRKNPNGILNGRNKLSEDTVMKIFKSRKNFYELASIYGVTRAAIGNIKNGRIWSTLTGKEVVSKNFINLTEKQILDIFNSPLTQVELAKKYGIRQGRISSIKTGRSHSNITKVKFKGKSTYTYFGQTTTHSRLKKAA